MLTLLSYWYIIIWAIIEKDENFKTLRTDFLFVQET